MSYQILLGDCRQTLAQLATGSVQTCISSPPYWNLRDYGVDGQIGLEAVPDCLAWARQEPPCGGCFVCSMRSVYGAELRRVLADDGTVWVNLGDSYIGGGGYSPDSPSNVARREKGNHMEGNFSFSQRAQDAQPVGKPARAKKLCLPAKSLVGIPWRVALALQADGWILRQSIIWHKPNPMTENVRDRCTSAHEHIFLLAKKPHYYFNPEAIQEPALYAGEVKPAAPTKKRAGLPIHEVEARSGHSQHERIGERVVGATRNKRNVWTISPARYPGAHFATYPPELIRPCVLAGSRPGNLVLDLFNGSGTTGQVALEEGRRYVGCELNPDYITLTHKRLSKVQTRMQLTP